MRTVRVGAAGWLLLTTTLVGQSLAQGPEGLYDPQTIFAPGPAPMGAGALSNPRLVDFNGNPSAAGLAPEGAAAAPAGYGLPGMPPPGWTPPPPPGGLGASPFLPMWGNGDYSPFAPRYYFHARGVFSDGLGYQNGYQTYGGFVPVFQWNPNNLIFNNTRILLPFTGGVGVNTGTGFRHLYNDAVIFSGSAWFDTDLKEYGIRYNQVAANLELLTQYFDIYANGYIPVGRTNYRVSTILGTTPMFQGNSIVFQDLFMQSSALTGGDITAGIPVPGQPWLKNYIGLYYYNKDFSSGSFWGFRYRLEARIDESTTTQLRVTSDEFFGTRVAFAVEYTLGNGWKPFRPFRQRTMQQRMYEQPFRYNRIVSHQTRREEFTRAINPATNRPFFVEHVDNSSLPGGNGTFEHPFNTLVAAQDPRADLILVARGNSSAANPIAGGIQLFDNQRLLGEGTPHFVTSANRGTFLLPHYATTGGNPYLSAPDNINVITLASNNEVSGFNIIAPSGGAAIGTTGTPIHDFNINTINQDLPAGQTTGPGNGIVLTNVSGMGTIRDVQFASTLPTVSSGIIVQNTGVAPLDLNMQNVNLVQEGTGLRLTADNSQITANLQNIQVGQTNDGADLFARNGGLLTFNLTNSHFDNPQTAGLTYTVDRGSIVSTVTNTDILNAGQNSSGPGGNSIRVVGSGSVAVQMQNVNLLNSTQDGILFNMTDTGGPTQLNFALQQSTIATPSGVNAATGTFDGPATTARIDFQNVMRNPNSVFLQANNGAQVFFNSQPVTQPGGQSF